MLLFPTHMKHTSLTFRYSVMQINVERTDRHTDGVTLCMCKRITHYPPTPYYPPKRDILKGKYISKMKNAKKKIRLAGGAWPKCWRVVRSGVKISHYFHRVTIKISIQHKSVIMFYLET